MVSRRLAREEGHRRKFLCVIDDTPECDRALVYAATRARDTAGGLVLLYVIPPGDFQHWRGVEEMMRVAVPVAWRTRTTPEQRSKVLANHIEIAEAIEAGDPDRAARAMDAHFDASVIRAARLAP